jgi:hypothetical protein
LSWGITIGERRPNLFSQPTLEQAIHIAIILILDGYSYRVAIGTCGRRLCRCLAFVWASLHSTLPQEDDLVLDRPGVSVDTPSGDKDSRKGEVPSLIPNGIEIPFCRDIHHAIGDNGCVVDHIREANGVKDLLLPARLHDPEIFFFGPHKNLAIHDQG